MHHRALLIYYFSTLPLTCVNDREQDHFSSEDHAFAKVVADSIHLRLFRDLCSHGDIDPSVTFTMLGGNGASRLHAWRAIHVFTQHSAQTVMPAAIAYPGLVDPGAGNPLPLVFASWFGLFHVLAALTQHAAGAPARGQNLTLEVTPLGHDMFSVVLA
jgi:hypothetical protein